MGLLRIFNTDFRDANLGHYKMIFADPPDNIGLKYDGYKDQIPRYKYMNLLYDVCRCINNCDILWISINAEHINTMGSVLESRRFVAPEADLDIRWIMQYVTFGTNLKYDFSKCFRPLVRIMRTGTETYPDAVRIESDRQKMGDKRADPRGKIPPDVWAIHRVTGNSKQKRKWHKTQLNQALYERCLDFSCKPGDKVADIFAGTGTMGRAAHGKHLDVDLFDISPFYCQQMAEEFETCVS